MDLTDVSNASLKKDRELLTSRRSVLGGAVVAAAGFATSTFGTPLTALADDNSEPETSTILHFSTLAGIQRPFLGDAGLAVFRGVHGGGAPWILSAGNGTLTSDGHLNVRVRGLVLDPASVPAPLGGTNPIPFFMAIVSGFSTDLVNPVNLATSLFPASKTGDANIEATLTLPHPFFAPIVFVTSLPIGTPAAPRWFAVTGLQ
jgi:hypothetical protein